MKKRTYNARILIGLAILLFCGAYSFNNQKMFGASAALGNIAGLNSEEAIETFAAKLAEIPASKAGGYTFLSTCVRRKYFWGKSRQGSLRTGET